MILYEEYNNGPLRHKIYSVGHLPRYRGHKCELCKNPVDDGYLRKSHKLRQVYGKPVQHESVTAYGHRACMVVTAYHL